MEKTFDAGRGHSSDPLLALTLHSLPPPLPLSTHQQMTQGNVGSLLVFDPAKAGAAGTGGSVAPGDAVVGIVTERGKFFSFFFPFFGSFFLILHSSEGGGFCPLLLFPNYSSTLRGGCRASFLFAVAGAERQKRVCSTLCCEDFVPERKLQRGDDLRRATSLSLFSTLTPLSTSFTPEKKPAQFRPSKNLQTT